MGRGRKRKAGKREANGRIQRPSVVFDQGSDRTRAKFSVFGQDGSDAIGRAYVAGLLGDDGLNLRNAARSVFRAYWPMMVVGRYQCAIADKSGGAVNDDDPSTDRIKAREEWLTDTLRMVDRMGRDTRRAFDQLVIDINPDEGPSWLDSIIWHRQHGREPDRAHEALLERALEPLRIIAR